MCLKNEKRNLLNLLKIYSCQNCNKFYYNEELLIGYNIINIYHINRCEKDNAEVYNNMKLKKLLYEYCINQDNSILLWEDENLFKLEDLDVILKFDLNIHIITK